MKEFIEYVARGLVDHPDAVAVEEERWRDRVVLRLSVDDTDMGKVIGKGGRVSLDIGEAAPRRSGVRRSGWRWATGRSHDDDAVFKPGTA